MELNDKTTISKEALQEISNQMRQGELLSELLRKFQGKLHKDSYFIKISPIKDVLSYWGLPESTPGPIVELAHTLKLAIEMQEAQVTIERDPNSRVILTNFLNLS